MRKIYLHFKLVSVASQPFLKVDIPNMDIIGWSIPKKREDIETICTFVDNFISGVFVGSDYSLSSVYSIEFNRRRVKSFKVYDHVKRDLEQDPDYDSCLIKPDIYKNILEVYLEELDKFKKSPLLYMKIVEKGNGMIKRELLI